jgi:hypothetical protein
MLKKRTYKTRTYLSRLFILLLLSLEKLFFLTRKRLSILFETNGEKYTFRPKGSFLGDPITFFNLNKKRVAFFLYFCFYIREVRKRTLGRVLNGMPCIKEYIMP